MVVSTSAEPAGLRRTLTTPKVVFLVIAAAAPLAAVVGTVPLAFAIGNGPGLPAMFLFAGLTLLCFSVGYAAMSRKVVNAGGFYTYLACGLGKPIAVAGGMVAVLAYNAMTIGLAGAFGYFTQLVAHTFGLDLPWQLWAAVGVAAMALLGYRQVDLSARLLAVLLTGEIAMLLLLNIAVLGKRGTQALPATSFEPGVVFSGGVGVAMMFAFISFIGFESAALYGEETRNPRRSVPVATYTSVIVISVFYALTSWFAVGAIGADHVVETASSELGNLFLGLSEDFLGELATALLAVLLCTSLFAAMLALHNAGSRYMFALGRERVLPAALGVVHPRHQSPHRASVVQTMAVVVVVAVFAVSGLHPYVNLATTMLGVGTLGIILLQATAAISVIVFFARRPDRHWWRTGLAPLAGAVGLITALVLLLANFPLLTGTESALVNATPWLLVFAVAGGLGYAAWLRAARGDRYAGIAAVTTRDDTVSANGGVADVRPDLPAGVVAEPADQSADRGRSLMHDAH